MAHERRDAVSRFGGVPDEYMYPQEPLDFSNDPPPTDLDVGVYGMERADGQPWDFSLPEAPQDQLMIGEPEVEFSPEIDYANITMEPKESFIGPVETASVQGPMTPSDIKGVPSNEEMKRREMHEYLKRRLALVDSSPEEFGL